MNLVKLVNKYLDIAYKNLTIDYLREEKLAEEKLAEEKLAEEKIKQKAVLVYKLKIFNSRMQSNRVIKSMINKITFYKSNDENLLGTNNIFCDRKIIYYNDKLENMTEEKIDFNILCAFFNSWQNYMITTVLSDRTKKITAYNSALFMYHIGIIKEKLWYSAQRYKSVLRLIATNQEIFDIYQIHEPNQFQSDYIMLKAIETKDTIYGNINNLYITTDAIEANVQISCLNIKESDMYLQDILSTTTTYFIINDKSKIRSIWNNKKLKVHKEATSIIKKMINV